MSRKYWIRTSDDGETISETWSSPGYFKPPVDGAVRVEGTPHLAVSGGRRYFFDAKTGAVKPRRPVRLWANRRTAEVGSGGVQVHHDARVPIRVRINGRRGQVVRLLPGETLDLDWANPATIEVRLIRNPRLMARPLLVRFDARSAPPPGGNP